MNEKEIKRILKKMPFKEALLWVGIIYCKFDLNEQYCELLKTQTTVIFSEEKDRLYAPGFFLPKTKENLFYPEDQIVITVCATTEEKLLKSAKKEFERIKKEQLENFGYKLKRMKMEVSEE